MNAVKSVELSIRAAMIMKVTSDLVGTKSVVVSRLVVQGIKEKLMELEQFLDTAEVDK